jgi:hypothetical protein
MTSRITFALLLFFLATGFTECDAFEDVTVPVTDSEPPVPFNGIWYQGDYTVLTFEQQPVLYTAEPGEPLVIVAGGLDRGGVRSVTFAGSSGMTCCRRRVCSTYQTLTEPNVQTQDGAVGSTVSNGVWASTGMTVPGCDARSTSGSWSYTWQVTVEDFHGNRVVGPPSSASWRMN